MADEVEADDIAIAEAAAEQWGGDAKDRLLRLVSLARRTVQAEQRVAELEAQAGRDAVRLTVEGVAGMIEAGGLRARIAELEAAGDALDEWRQDNDGGDAAHNAWESLRSPAHPAQKEEA